MCDPHKMIFHIPLQLFHFAISLLLTARQSQSPLDLVSPSSTHFPLQMTTVALKHTHANLQLEPHQEEKIHLQFV